MDENSWLKIIREISAKDKSLTEEPVNYRHEEDPIEERVSPNSLPNLPMREEFAEESDEFAFQANIKVVGIGGGGGNAVNRMVEEGIQGVEFVAVNTDSQALRKNKAKIRLQIGNLRGLGAGKKPEVGRMAAEESKDRIRPIIEGVDLLFITAGMGGGTGTGASPVVAQIAKELGVLTVAVVTKPFDFEGPERMRIAEQGIEALAPYVDTLIVISNERLLKIVGDKMDYEEAFRYADQVLLYAIKGISEIITKPGIVNVDFADVRSTLTGAGHAWFGMGIGKGENKAIEAAKLAVTSPLIEYSVEGASRILINFTSNRKAMTLADINNAVNYIRDIVGKDTSVIFGTTIDESLKDEILVSLIAAGFSDKKQQQVRSTISANIDIDMGDFEVPAFLRRNKGKNGNG